LRAFDPAIGSVRQRRLPIHVRYRE